MKKETQHESTSSWASFFDFRKTKELDINDAVEGLYLYGGSLYFLCLYIHIYIYMHAYVNGICINVCMCVVVFGYILHVPSIRVSR